MSDDLSIPANIKEALERYAAAERKRMDNPIIKDLITWRSLAQKILKDSVQRAGHWEPKKKEG